MNIKEKISKVIKHQTVDSIPMMYRGLPDTDKRLNKYFHLDEPEKDWKKLLKKLGADLMSTGYTLSKYTVYFPEYIGPYKNLYNDHCFFNSWGLDSETANTRFGEYVHYACNSPLRDASISEIINYKGPEIDHFNFNNFNLDVSLQEENFFCTGTLDYIFMIAMWLRGEDQFLLDLAANKKLAQVLIDKIGEFAFEINKEIYKKHGNKLDMFGLWDDVADQKSLLMRPETWRQLFKKWYKKIIETVKKYDQIVLFHCCGNCNAIIPDFIEIGVDILDPIQTSALDMDFYNLKKKYGNNITFHGGIDVQKLLPFGTVSQIKDEVKKIKKLFETNDGIILGPSHEIPNDVPIENILAIYK
ncbi:MAG: hypothetical protein M1479_07740 [Actinobacteria bacterium]|nr:hypothetical protein [Cyanobacteriota bacterium]MCL5772150.1 hypothetical protein [Actinomycetota bacterium]